MTLRAVVAAGPVAAFALALFACRAVLGIDQLELADAAPDSALPEASSGHEAAPPAESGAVDAPADSAIDVETFDGPSREAAPPDANPYSACVAEGQMCRPCCHMSYNAANMELTNDVIMGGCLCGMTGCASECSTSLCAMPPQGGANVPMTCNMCYDTVVLPPTSQACMQAVATCRGSATCRDIIDCLMACP
jgi:hypothetical protein